MKVLQINSVCGIRSTGRICTDIAEFLEQQGHECKIAYGREVVPEKYQRFAVRIGNDLSVKLDGIKTRILDNAGFNSTNATRRFLAWVKEYNPDIIHLHNLHGYYINIRILFNFLQYFNKPVVWTLHDCWAFTGHCAYFDYACCNRWKLGCEKCPQKTKYPASCLLTRAKKNWSLKKTLFTSINNMVLVSPSYWLAGLTKESFLGKYPVKVINNGIDIDAFKPTPSDFRIRYSLIDKKVILGVASSWDERKGLRDFIELSKMIDDNYKIVIVGLTKKQIETMPKCIICIEQTNSVKELAEIYTTVDVFVNPTYEDNYPTTNLEAQACGTPVITYNTGGSVESIIQQSGIIVPKGDISALLKTARSIQLDRNKVVLEAQKFDKSKKYLEYLQIYERCLE